MSHDDAARQGEQRAIKTETLEESEASPSQSQSHNQELNAPLPKGLEMYQHNPLLACLVCSRQVSANRYAQHLASCVGVGKGGIARRKGKNGLGSSSAKDRMKIKTALENRRKANFQTQSNRNTPTPSSRPEQESMSGASDDESSLRTSSECARLHESKANRPPNTHPSHPPAETPTHPHALNGNGKRGRSPSMENSPKKAKHRTPPPGRSAFVPSGLGTSLPVTGSPLNPLRNGKPVHVLDDDEEEDDGGDEEEEEEEEEEEDGEDGEEEDEEEEDDDDDDDDNSVAIVNGQTGHATTASVADSFDEDSASDGSEGNASLLSAQVPKQKTSAGAAGAIERSKGSDGEYIDVESASAHSEADDDF